LSAASCCIDAGTAYLAPVTDFKVDPRPDGSGYDIGAYELMPALELSGISANATIQLNWRLNVTLPLTATWTIIYDGPPGDQLSPISALQGIIRTFTLTGLTNYVPYHITLNAILDSTPILSDTIIVMPTDITLYLPVMLK